MRVSRFPAELTVVLTDGHSYTECFNQAEMARFMRESMLDRLRRGEPLAIFDGERIEIPADRVASVAVVMQDPVAV